MTFFWLIILIIYGLTTGWDHIHPLMWLLLIPFAAQDIHDSKQKGTQP